MLRARTGAAEDPGSDLALGQLVNLAMPSPPGLSFPSAHGGCITDMVVFVFILVKYA